MWDAERVTLLRARPSKSRNKALGESEVGATASTCVVFVRQNATQKFAGQKFAVLLVFRQACGERVC
jgi:hypothetical protein